MTYGARHVAIIMDGNGRWAASRGQPRPYGHRAGVEALRRIVRAAPGLGIEYLSVYAFSTENWKRPPEEVEVLMDLLVEYLRGEVDELDREQVKIVFLGDDRAMPARCRREMVKAKERTARNPGLVLAIAVNYGGRDEIVRAVRRAMEDPKKAAELDEETFGDLLDTAGMPDPDLVIRPSGELRLSNFLLWQSAYAEIYATPVYWPDFDEAELRRALEHFGQRDRRYGGHA
ncbi:MAG: isoprenyl transferase [Thermaerobacter sp.]|nr:isoprenyl transferase [Thermaerobacter sp.]